MASYRADFRSDAPLKPGWQYLWNAPTGWDPTTNSTGDMATGSINDASNFRPMLDAGTYWTADGDTDGVNHGPDNYVKLTATGGHPGSPAGGATGGGTNGLARYAIAAYTFSTDGYYAIANSWLNKPSTDGDPVEVRVSVNGGSPFVDLFANPGATFQYDAYLGQLHAGDTVYVAFGPNTSHFNDAFGTDFSIVETSARPEPLRSLTAGQHFNVADYGATPDDATNDAPGIQAAMNAANTWQQQNHRPVEVDFAPGQYRLYAGYVAGSPSTLLTLRNARDMVIAGNGAQLLVTDPSVGAFMFNTCSNMIVQGFTIDYETVPFTQGYITQVIDAHNFVLDVQPGFPPPSDPQFVNASDRWGYPVDPVIAGRIRQDAYINYSTTNATSLGGSRYQITISSSTSTLHVGDRYVEQARTNGAIIYFAGCVQVSAIGVTAYAGPGVFVAAQFSDAVNVIDCHAAISPGRWKSLDADGVHIQSARVGAWIESSSLEGLSDDSIAFYTVPFAVMQVVSDTQFKVGALLNRGSTVGVFAVRHFRPGDHLTFFNPSAGTPLGNVQVTAVDLTAQTITVDQPVTGITTGTTSLVTNVYNTDLSGSFMVQGNTILNGRRYGVFIKASNGQVLNNHFEGLSNEAISIHNDPGWPEGLWGGNILIQGNAFVDNGFEYRYKYQTSRVPGTIGIHAEKLGYLPVNGIYVHPNIQVLDNTFLGWRRAAIAAGNVANLEIRGNHFLAPVIDPLIAQDTVIVLTSADGVSMVDNSRPGLTAPDAFLTQDSFCFNVTESGTWIDHPPAAISLSAQAIAEDRAIGSVVGDLTSTDADTGDTFTYTLVDANAYPDNAAFVVEDGRLKTAVTLDYENRSSYSICVRTTDSGAMWLEQTLTFQVSDVNDAPLLDNTGTMTLAAITENDTFNSGTLVWAIIASAGGDRIYDQDIGAGEGIAVVGVQNSNGVWQYKIGSAGSWTAFGTPSAAEARLLPCDSATWVRFVPNANWSGTVTDGITFRAWDQTSGTAGGTADTSTSGGTAAFSSTTQTASITVTSVSSLDTDGNGSADALSDGILILRYLFDPTGAWNVNDALGSSATRTTREAIKGYLDAGENAALDVDSNGSADALTDGILILRYLFDPAGAWNYSDALGTGATRTTREQIKGFLDQFNPSLAASANLSEGLVTQVNISDGTVVAPVTAPTSGSDSLVYPAAQSSLFAEPAPDTAAKILIVPPPSQGDTRSAQSEVAGITVWPISGLVTTEAGGTATFTLVLNTQPSDDVRIGLLFSYPGEGIPSTSSVTFTAADWNLPQTVTVTGADDSVIDGDVAYSIVTEAALSSDANYMGLDPSDVSAVNRDNDARPPESDTIGLFDPTTSVFYLRNTNSTGLADYTFGYGDPSQNWTKLVGDWDGNAQDTIEFFDPDTSTWYLRNSLTTGAADVTFGYGAPGAGWQAMTGCWWDPSQASVERDGANTLSPRAVDQLALSALPAEAGALAELETTLIGLPQPAANATDWLMRNGL